MPTLTTRDLEAADLDAMSAVAAECFERPWSAAACAEELAADGRDYVGAFAGHLVGFAGTAEFAGEVHVMTVAVLPTHRRRGIGRELVTTLLDRAGARGQTTVTLEVRAGEVGARELYEGLGFETVGMRPGYYRDDDAVIMTRTGA